MPEQPSAGPLRPPQVQPVRSPTRSRSLASLLKGKEVSSNDLSLLSPVSPTSSASMRRAPSHEDAPGLSGEVPPLPPPKTAMGKPLTDPLLHAARAKMSSQDQEAMRKLRSTMVELSEEGSTKSPTASTSASTSNSPNSPMFPSIATPASSHQLRPRRSTLSRLVVPEEETPFANPLLAPAQYHIAVLGHSGAGKTTLLNRALKTWGVSPPDNVPYATQNVTTYRSNVKPGGKLKLSSDCELLELALDCLNIEDEGSGLFPDGLPRISGAVLCYDARAGESLRLIPETIHRLVAAGIPTIMYACKSDPDAALQIDAAHANSIGEAYNVGLIEVTDTTSEGRSKMRNGMRWLLYKMEQRLIRRRRKATGSPTSAPTVLSADSDGGSSADRLMWPAKLGMTPSSASGSKRGSMTSEARSSSSDLQWIVQGSGHSASQADSTPASAAAAVPGTAVNDDLKPKSDADNAMWVGLQDLFNQLFSKIVSSSDDLFVDSFFMTYRRFCQPSEVMAHFLDRYKRIEGYPVAQASKNWTLQRLTSALIDWTADYPGDLADIVTQSLFRQILQLLLKYTFMAHLTVSLAEVEATLPDLRDLDSSWAIKLSESTISLKSTQSELVINEGLLYDLESPLDKSEEVLTPMTREHSASVRTASTTSLNLDNMRTGSGSLGTGSLQDERMVKSIDEAGSKWSGALGFVLNTDPKVFAAELTKRQWQLFAAIRPRDVFRHDFGKEKDDPIGDAITFFNHLSRWVSTVILADPKAKYRARAFERFMMIAHELRRLNNYDSLYALMSGMQETSIHRLSQTHALVQPPLDVSKNFQSHSKLMDARGNYTHYQRALRADIDAGRPAIPLITILISLVAKMQSVRREDIRPDGMVQWDKFMRFGEILAIVPKCQARGAIVPGTPSKTFMTILHNVPVIHDEDVLFDRSRMLEPPGAAYQQPNVLKRFGKLAMA